MSTKADSRLEDEVRKALEQGRHVQTRMRDITLKALTRGELDQEALREVTREVLHAVQSAAQASGSRAKDTMAEAVAGVDDALAHAAQALKLSIEEAGSRAEKFSREDLAKARDNLKSMERIFFDTLRETAKASRGAASSAFDDALAHMQSSGTAVGRQLKENVGALSGGMAEAGRAQFDAGVKAAVSSGAMMARIASGVLAGIADSLSGAPKNR